MSTRSAESRDNSPDGGSPEKRASKKRKVLSCYACRNRKMKCDRVYPVCGRCQRTGRADQCTYDPRLLEDLPVNGDGHVGGSTAAYAPPDGPLNGAPSAAIQSDALNWRIRSQERRLDTLEKRLVRMDDAKNVAFGLPPSHLDNSDAQGNEPAAREEMMFRGKGFKTQFYGSTSPFSLFSQSGELQSFTREAMVSDLTVIRIRCDFKEFRNRRKAAMKEKGLKAQGSDAEILALVPEKRVVDAQMALYFQTFENSYRILHEGTFWNDYRVFWEQHPGVDTPASFATILVLIVAITKCLSAKEDTVFVGDSAADRESASVLIEACDAWLLRQSRKHLTIHHFQLQCLSILAKRVNCLKLKQDWVNSGDMIRLAMAAGMHRNPSLIAGGRISEYEKEMRRRLWATMMELELQSSIDFGLQSSLCGLHFDIQPPANVPDEAFSSDSTQAPTSRPIEHFTGTSYLVLSLQSLPLRVHLMQLLNNPTTNLQYSDVLHYDTQITSILSSLPSWNTPRAVMASALLDIQLRQFLLILHRPYAKLAHQNPRFNYSFSACVGAANALLALHDDLNSRGIFTLNHLRNDLLRAGITLSQVVYHNASFPSPPEQSAAHTPVSNAPASVDTGELSNPMKTSALPGPELKVPHLPLHNFMATNLCTSAIDLMERSSSLFERKVMRLGTGYMEFWLLCASIGIMPSTASSGQPITSSTSTTNADDIRSRIRRTIDRVAGLCFRVIAMQKDPENSLASSLRSTMTAASPPDMRTPASAVLPLGPESNLVHPGASGMSAALREGPKDVVPQLGPWDGLADMHLDMAEWTFPDFWAFDMTGEF